MEKASVTISRPRKGSGEDVISITIKDPLSRQTIIGVEMDAAEFTLCLTGLDECDARVERLSPPEHRDRWGRQRITKSATCPKVFGKTEQADEVQKAFVEEWEPHGWLMWDDGIRSQQRGDMHKFIVMRFVEPEVLCTE